MGVWNSHTSFGNILGSVVASAYVSWAWGYSFVVPGVLIGCVGFIAFFTLIDSKCGILIEIGALQWLVYSGT